MFCEGDSTSLDNQLYGAWFAGPDTVVRAVGDCNRVIRCVDAIANSGIASALTAVGVIDSDYRSDAFKAEMPSEVKVLAVHEAETLLCPPSVVSSVCQHVSRPFDESAYRVALAATVSEPQCQQIIIERWKQRLEPHLEGLVAGVSGRSTPVADLVVELPNVFDYTKWAFSPEGFLIEERERVEAAVPDGPLDDFLAIVPGKQLVPIAARQVGMQTDGYTKLILDALGGESGNLKALGEKIESALAGYLPARYVPIKGIPTAT